MTDKLRFVLGVILLAPFLGALEGQLIGSLTLFALLYREPGFSFQGLFVLGAFYGIPIGVLCGIFLGTIMGWRLRRERCLSIVVWSFGVSSLGGLLGVVLLFVLGVHGVPFGGFFPLIPAAVGFGVGYMLLEGVRPTRQPTREPANSFKT